MALVLAIPSLGSAQSGAYGEEEVEFANGDVTLAGVVLVPVRTTNAPGIVVIHGSGTSDRSNAWAAAFARGLAERGMVVLLPDKRGSGKSGGDWRRASFQELADDAIAAVETLRGHSRVERNSVGVLGLSQGGHIAPLAATRSSQVAFAINISGSTVPIAEQVFDEVEKMAERAGLTEQEIERVNALHRRAIHYGLTGEGWEAYHENLEQELSGDLAGRGIIEPFPSTPDDWVWEWARTVGRYDPLPFWQQLTVPSLIVYGARDTQIRVGKSASRLVGALESEGRNYTLLVFGDSGHALRDPHTHEVRPDLLDFVVRWVGNQGLREGGK